jgi:hypothetical protein
MSSPPVVPLIPPLAVLAPSPITMSLLQFDKTVRLSECGKIFTEIYDPSFNQWDAISQCNVPVNAIRDIFAFQSDYIDVNDIISNDIRFYVDSNKIPTLDLSNNIVSSGAVINVDQFNNDLSGNALLLQKDYVRHLANKLFNTPYGVDLFVNETELVNSVTAALVSAWESCKSDLQNVSTKGTNGNLKGSTDHKYLLDDALDASGNSTFNICRELFKMLVSRASSRFVSLPQTMSVSPDDVVSIDNTNTAKNLYRLPFVAGDKLVMRVVLQPCEHQSSFQTDPQKDIEIQGNKRAYLLHLNLV